MALYDNIGRGYAALRRPDPRIAAAIETALGDAVSVVNIGAGTGSYEPPGRTVLKDASGRFDSMSPQLVAPVRIQNRSKND